MENSRDLVPALKNAFTCKVPVILSVPIDYRENTKLTDRLGDIQCPI
ncbi:MAG: hypothetical protein ACE5DO_02575 [Desulfobacterales bacterium]